MSGSKAAQALADRQNEGAFLGNLGDAYRNLGEVEKAKDYLQQSLVIFTEIKSPNAARVQQRLDELDQES